MVSVTCGSAKYQFSQCSQIKYENQLFFCLKGRTKKFVKNLENKYDLNVELILISEITNSEIRITLTLRNFCQAGMLTGCQDLISKKL